MPLTHAVHRLSGIVTPASAAYSARELEHQLRSSGAKAIFTCAPLLDNARVAARAVAIPDDRIFLLPLPGHASPSPRVTVDDLVLEGQALPPVEPLRWVKGQSARQTAYLAYSSGTSGLPVRLLFFAGASSGGGWVLIPCAEGRHDLPFQRHRKHHPDLPWRFRHAQAARHSLADEPRRPAI